MSRPPRASALDRTRSEVTRYAKGARRRFRRFRRQGVEWVKLTWRRTGAERLAGSRPVELLTPREALAENGFFVFRGLFDAEETAQIAGRLKRDLKIADDTDVRERTGIDAAVRYRTGRELLFDDRILDAVRQGIGPGARFLQVADVQYNHDHTGWHRDSPYRGEDCSTTPDWGDVTAPYRVVKIIIYFESDNAGMGVLGGSHLDPIEMNAGANRAKERAGDYTVISRDDEPNRRFSPEEKARPMAWAAGAGDALLFDERMYHCGRRVEGDKVISDREGTKLTLSYVFGDDNDHSARMYSYFRFARTDLKYRPLPDELAADLDAHGLTPTAGWGNYYARRPEQLRGAYLRDPSQLDELIHRFAESAAAT